MCVALGDGSGALPPLPNGNDGIHVGALPYYYYMYFNSLFIIYSQLILHKLIVTCTCNLFGFGHWNIGTWKIIIFGYSRFEHTIEVTVTSTMYYLPYVL